MHHPGGSVATWVRQSEKMTTNLSPQKKPWLVGLYRGLYYPII